MMMEDDENMMKGVVTPGLTRICMAVSFGGWVTGLLWLVVGNPWVAVAIVAAVLGVYLLENGELQARAGAARAEVSELEKQVVGLRTTIHRMVQHNPDVDEVERRRAGFRLRREGSFGSSPVGRCISANSCSF